MSNWNEYHFSLFKSMCDCVDLYAAEEDAAKSGNGLVLYSHEPFAKQKAKLKSVIEWLNQHTFGNHNWPVILFCRDGYFRCSARGNKLSEELEAIEGTWAFDE